MKACCSIIFLSFAACSLGLSQEVSKGRIYIGTVKDAPPWAVEGPKLTANGSQAAAWTAYVESISVQERAEALKAMAQADKARAEYLVDPRTRMLRQGAGGPQYVTQRGIVLDYVPLTARGAISGEDGRRWLFRGADWSELDPFGSPTTPVKGLWVDFLPETETGFALFIHSLGTLDAVSSHLDLGGRLSGLR